MPPFDPNASKNLFMRLYRNRIDILKRMNIHPKAKNTKLDEDIYERTPVGVVIRIVEKKPSKYALRKNTKRARKFAAAQKEA